MQRAVDSTIARACLCVPVKRAQLIWQTGKQRAGFCICVRTHEQQQHDTALCNLVNCCIDWLHARYLANATKANTATAMHMINNKKIIKIDKKPTTKHAHVPALWLWVENLNHVSSINVFANGKLRSVSLHTFIGADACDCTQAKR